MYLLRIPFWLRRCLPKGLWGMPAGIQLSLYLTFDDGPHPEITPFVLAQLAKYKAKGTFFCVGDNVLKYPEVYQQILTEGHKVGNHTFHHLNGWKTKAQDYIDDVSLAKQQIDAPLFRPPYGRIRHSQAKALNNAGFEVVYWSLLSGDFDVNLSPQDCLKNVSERMRPGDIIVFHDSEKAWDRLSFVLPLILEQVTNQGWQLKSL